ncbi:MAG: DUF302 domain-containing protein [Chloroflexota bacterium]|nr:DUF302 domain-containing protein [Chloroflexota bacterium]
MDKKTLLAGIAGFLIGVVVLGVVAFVAAPGIMMVEDASPLSYENTVEAVLDATAEQGWKVPATHEISTAVNKAGYDVAPVTVIELCQPHHAARVLLEDDARIVTSMMPCRVSVYETSDGQVVVSRMNTGLISKLFGGTVATVMADATADTEVILSSVLN